MTLRGNETKMEVFTLRHLKCPRDLAAVLTLCFFLPKSFEEVASPHFLTNIPEELQ
jgi:hypothetical protein